MPTLPGRATSITEVLARHQSHDHAAPTSFDWHALVRDRRPGDQTPEQRQQAQRFARIRLDASQWAETLALPHEHLSESAFYATVATSPDAAHEQALALAMTVYWIYLLDDFLDRQDFDKLAEQPSAQVGASLDARLAAILRPVAGESHREAWWRSGRRATHGPAQSDDPPGDCARLADALASLLAALRAAWAHLPGERDRERLVACELSACAAAMRQEVLWNVAFARRHGRQRLPSLADYLHGGEISIGMPAVAAVLASFELHPDMAWRDGIAAILAGGRVVRLTNDLHTYFADAEEGKVTAITIGLEELGFPTRGLDPETSEQVWQAQQRLAGELARAIDTFATRHAQLGEGPLGFGVRHAVAFALAVYGDGSRVHGNSSAA